MKKILMVLTMVAAMGLGTMKANNADKAISPVIEGQIKDKISGEVLTGVAVYLDGELKAYTDFDGAFKIEGIQSGKHTISTDFVSYKEQKQELVLEREKNISIEIEPLQ
jgi:hypothetical protein